jgi:hypothetical protein
VAVVAEEQAHGRLVVAARTRAAINHPTAERRGQAVAVGEQAVVADRKVRRSFGTNTGRQETWQTLRERWHRFKTQWWGKGKSRLWQQTLLQTGRNRLEAWGVAALGGEIMGV